MPTNARLLVLIQYFTNRLAVETDPVVRAGWRGGWLNSGPKANRADRGHRHAKRSGLRS
jgi:hypothetical protein